MSVNGGARAERRSGLVLVLTSAVAFAIGPIAAKIALDNGSNVLTVVTLRGAIGAALLALLVVLFRQGFRISRAALYWCLLCGVFSALMVYGIIGAVATIPISVAILIFFVHPIVIAVIMHWRGGDRLTGGKLVLALTALAGLALALAPTFDTLELKGIALAALAAITVCGAILCGARAQQYATSTQVNLYVTGAWRRAVRSDHVRPRRLVVAIEYAGMDWRHRRRGGYRRGAVVLLCVVSLSQSGSCHDAEQCRAAAEHPVGCADPRAVAERDPVDRRCGDDRRDRAVRSGGPA